MSDADDRLAGDPIWELFPNPAPGARPARDYRRWLALAGLVVGAWLIFPPLGVAMACLAFAIRDVRIGRQLARSIPDKAGGTICACFSYALAASKFGLVAFSPILGVLLLIAFRTAIGVRDEAVTPSAPWTLTFFSAMFLWVGGFTASAALTACGLFAAHRSGMRIWVGQGVNRARSLVLAMLITGFALGALAPVAIWMAANGYRPRAETGADLAMWAFVGCIIAGPATILDTLDWIGRRVVADRPGKFGPKVPAIGKWNS